MSCCKNKYTRQSNLELVKILAEQYATVNNETMVVLELKHGVYGLYYDFVPKKDYENIKSPYYGKPVLFEFGAVEPAKVSTSVGKKRAKPASN